MKVTSALAVACIAFFGTWGLLHPRELPARPPAPHWIVIEGNERILRSPAGYQTVSKLDGGRTGRYYDSGELAGTLRPKAKTVALLGLGGGEMLRAARRTLPNARLIGVEIDPATAELAVSDFRVDELGVEVQIADALDWPSLQKKGSVDVLMVDVYEDSVLPAPFQRLSFFADCYCVLAPDGLLIMNVGPLTSSRPVKEQLEVLFKVTTKQFGPNVVLLGEKR